MPIVDNQRIFGLLKPWFLACLILLAAAGSAAADVPWKLIKEKNGIRTYVRELPGTSVKEFKAIGIIDARLEVIAQVLRDIPAYPQWFPQCKEAALLDQQGLFDFVFYLEMNLPWPLWDRDVILKTSVDIDEALGRATARFHAVKNRLVPEKDRHVRLTRLSGDFLFEYIGRNSTRVVLSYQLDPGGGIPLALANLAIGYMPYKTLRAIAKTVRDPKYIEMAETSEEKKMVEELLGNREVVERAMRGRLTEYFQHPVLVEGIVADQAFCERVLREDSTYADLRAQVAEIIRTILTRDDLAEQLDDKELAAELESRPRLARRLMNDDRLAEMILDGAGTFEGILKERIKSY